MNVLDLFSGIGGFSLGLERAGMKTVAFCEIEEFPRKVLAKYWPDVPIFEDIKRLDEFEADVVCGGFPCQPFSTASHGVKVAENLWPEMGRVVWRNMPKIVIAENVQREAIEHAARQLEMLGYGCTVKNIGATDCGADHQRVRWWCIAHPYDKGKFSRTIDAEVAELPQLCKSVWGAENYSRAIRISDGLPYRMDRLKALGNAVLPQITEAIGRAIMRCQATVDTN